LETKKIKVHIKKNEDDMEGKPPKNRYRNPSVLRKLTKHSEGMEDTLPSKRTISKDKKYKL
jgi:hypothetical protein